MLKFGSAGLLYFNHVAKEGNKCEKKKRLT